MHGLKTSIVFARRNNHSVINHDTARVERKQNPGVYGPRILLHLHPLAHLVYYLTLAEIPQIGKHLKQLADGRDSNTDNLVDYARA